MVPKRKDKNDNLKINLSLMEGAKAPPTLPRGTTNGYNINVWNNHWKIEKNSNISKSIENNRIVYLTKVEENCMVYQKKIKYTGCAI